MTLWNKYKNHPFQWSEIKTFLNGFGPLTQKSKKKYTRILGAALVSVSDKYRIDSTTDVDMIHNLVLKFMSQRPYEVEDAKSYLKKTWKNMYNDVKREIRKERRKKSDIEEGIKTQITSAFTQSNQDIEEVRTAVLEDILFQFLTSRKGRMKDEWDNLHKIYTGTIAPRALLRWRNRIEKYMERSELEIKKKIQDEMSIQGLHPGINQVETEFNKAKICLLVARNDKNPRWGIHTKNADSDFHKPSFLRLKPQYVLFPDYKERLYTICKSIEHRVMEELRK